MQSQTNIEKKIRNLKQAKWASFVMCVSFNVTGFILVAIAGQHSVQAIYNGFIAISAGVIFLVLAGIAKNKLKQLEGI